VAAPDTQNPFKAADPDMKVTVGGKSGAGAWYAIDGKKAGSGTITLTRSVPGKLVEQDLDLKGRDKSWARFDFAEAGGETEVKWTFGVNDAGFVGRYVGLVMDRLIGPYLERGLAALKQAAEATPATEPTAIPAISPGTAPAGRG
jgi:hypothetical protein